MSRKTIVSIMKFKGYLIALCDDGTLWAGNANPLTGNVRWVRMEDIPSDF